jgi:23S rRNA (guanosine2251-2'-O)-methyltransferase
LRLHGIEIVAADVRGKQTLPQLSLKEPTCIIMGSEDKGIYPPLLKLCHTTFRIPMSKDFESLNVSVSTGIILAEAYKQRINS